MRQDLVYRRDICLSILRGIELDSFDELFHPTGTHADEQFAEMADPDDRARIPEQPRWAVEFGQRLPLKDDATN